jgi:hypothetical protein
MVSVLLYHNKISLFIKNPSKHYCQDAVLCHGCLTANSQLFYIQALVSADVILLGCYS